MSLFKKDRMREQFSAPSFSLKVGDVFNIENEKGLKELLNKDSYVVLFYPDIDERDVNSYARALAHAKYVIIPDSNKTAKTLYKAVEKVVFSPIVKIITGVYLAQSEDNALKVLSSFEDTSITVIPRCI